jgi:hypothetical protein
MVPLDLANSVFFLNLRFPQHDPLWTSWPRNAFLAGSRWQCRVLPSKAPADAAPSPGGPSGASGGALACAASHLVHPFRTTRLALRLSVTLQDEFFGSRRHAS